MPKKLEKKYHVRRYHYTQYRHHSSFSVILRTVVTVLVIAALGFVGWNAYGPVTAYLSGTLAASAQPKGEAPSSSAASGGLSGDNTESGGSSPEEGNGDEAAEVPPEPAPPAELRAIYLPTSVLLDTAAFDEQLERITKTNMNAVLFDLKDAAGNVLYYSGQLLVEQAASQSANAYDLRAVCEKLTQHNLIPMGRISAFADTKAPSKLTGAGVRYMNTEMLWLDDSRENGGKPWLNPYSSTAQAYILDIAAEAVSFGVKHILLDNVSFPIGYGLEYANFGENALTSSRTEALSSFVKLVQETISELGAEVDLYVGGMAAVGANNTYYGSNPLVFSKDVTIGVMPAQFGDGYTFENFTIDQPLLNPYGTVNSLLRFLTNDLSGKNVTAMVQCYTATGSMANNKVYTAEDISEQVRALADNHIGSYILYSPRGIYPEGIY